MKLFVILLCSKTKVYFVIYITITIYGIQMLNSAESKNEQKNGLKVNLNCLRTSNQSFLWLGISKTLSLGEFDASKNHQVLSLFFMHI